MKVVIAAAGEGTRFYPLSRVVPKELFPLGDRPLLQHLLEEAVAAGADEAVIVTSPRKGAIEQYFRHHPRRPSRPRTRVERELDRLLTKVSIRFVLQPRPLGLADAIGRAAPTIGSAPFAALVADTLHGRTPPVLAALRNAFERLGRPGGVVAVRRVATADLRRYGVIDPGPADGDCRQVRRIVEKPRPSVAPSRFALTGAYYLSPAVFGAIRRTRHASGEVGHLAAAFNELAARDGLYAWTAPAPPLDVGDLALWRAANRTWPVAGGR